MAGLLCNKFKGGKDKVMLVIASNATSSGGNNAGGRAKVVKCYNCQCEGHMARKCTQSKRPRNATWFKEKAMLAEAQKAGQILDEEKLAFLAVLMANFSNYGSDVISEIPHHEPYHTDMDNQSVHTMQGSCSFGSSMIMRKRKLPSRWITEDENFFVMLIKSFPDFGRFMVQYCGRTKECPQFPLMVSNLLFIKWEISYPKDKKDKKKQNQSKPTRNGKDKSRVRNEDNQKPDQSDTARKEPKIGNTGTIVAIPSKFKQ
ncbi:retrovirus-related pol polyprotein from transposon TNT 1-94 [Tanacetum coccineum]